MDKDRIILPNPADIEPEKIAPMMAQMAAIQLSLATRLVAESNGASASRRRQSPYRRGSRCEAEVLRRLAVPTGEAPAIYRSDGAQPAVQ